MRRILCAVSLLLLWRCSTASNKQPEAAPPPPQYANIPKFERGGDIQAPKVVKRVEPVAPPSMLLGGARRVSAAIEFVINAQGLVEDAWYSSGDREWARAAEAAIRQWQFEPARRNGEPIAVRYGVTLTFTSTGGGPRM